MRYFLAFIFGIAVTVASGQNTVNNYVVSDISSIQQVEISLDQMNSLAREYGHTADFSELKVEMLADRYILLAKDNAKKWVYAFELKVNGSELLIDIDQHINACESEKLSLDIFTVSNGDIVGCVKSEHHILGRN
jgi:hypothetical protein